MFIQTLFSEDPFAKKIEYAILEKIMQKKSSKANCGQLFIWYGQLENRWQFSFAEPKFSLESYDYFSLVKKSGKNFTKEEVGAILKLIELGVDLDFSKYEIQDFKIQRIQPFSYTDYLGQSFNLNTSLKSGKSETNKLLYHLYQKTVAF